MKVSIVKRYLNHKWSEVSKYIDKDYFKLYDTEVKFIEDKMLETLESVRDHKFISLEKVPSTPLMKLTIESLIAPSMVLLNSVDNTGSKLWTEIRYRVFSCAYNRYEEDSFMQILFIIHSLRLLVLESNERDIFTNQSQMNLFKNPTKSLIKNSVDEEYTILLSSIQGGDSPRLSDPLKPLTVNK